MKTYTEDELIERVSLSLYTVDTNDEGLWDLNNLVSQAEKTLSDITGKPVKLYVDTSGIYDGICGDAYDSYIMYAIYCHNVNVLDETTGEVREKCLNIKPFYGNVSFMGEDVDVYFD